MNCCNDLYTSVIGNMPRPIKMFLLLTLVAAILLGLTKMAAADPVYKFTSPNGSLAFTDNPKQIPAAAKDVKTFEMNSVPDRTTHVDTQPLPTSGYPKALSLPTPRVEDVPTGPTTVVREWVEENGIHRQVWKTVGPDGRVLMITPSSPRGLLVR